jgi:4-amino-4-deoxy-L-arabinose transferase-like glycosyltransferase
VVGLPFDDYTEIELERFVRRSDGDPVLAGPSPSENTASYPSYFPRHENPFLLFALCIAVIAVLTILRGVFAGLIDLRVDEAYYWTWSKESVVSFLDHPPMIAWCVRFGTLIFGDTNFGVRFTGLLAMPLMQLILADIVWRTLRDFRYVAIVVLLPEAAPDYGFLMAKVAPDTALIPFALAMVWSLVRLSLSDDLRWWLPAGLFGGLALLSKYTAVLLFPSILAFVLIPDWRTKQLSSPYPWLAALIALVIFSPVLYWNATHDWVSFKFQLDRPEQLHDWSAKFLLDFVGQQFALVGPLLLPVVLIGTSMLAWRGYRTAEPISILLSTCVIFPLCFLLWRSFHSRIGDSWPLFVWPFGFAAAVINLKSWREKAAESSMTRMAPAIISGLILVVAALIYYIAGNANYLGKNDPIGKEAGFAGVVQAASETAAKVDATFFATTDYRMYSMLRWHLKDRIPVVQINERNRYIDFKNSEKAFAGPVGLYVGPKNDPIMQLWKKTGAKLEPAGEVDLTWRGVRYDTYSLQRLTGWKPLLSPPPGDPFYVGSPH